MQVGKSRRPHGHPGNASPFNVSGLHSRNLRELVGQGDQHADFAFAYGAPEGPRAFVSTIKLRQAGFAKTIDTEDSFRNALQSLIDHKLLPDAWMRKILTDATTIGNAPRGARIP